MKNVMDNATENSKNNIVSKGKILIRHRGKICLIPINEILYLESQLHKINIVLENKQYQCTGRLEYFLERLGKNFLKCHKSYIVNMDYILEFCKKEITLSSGEKIPVSKSCYPNAKYKLYEYLNDE